MKTYDWLERVSRVGDRIVSADSTMTLRDQERLALDEIKRRGGRAGKRFQAANQSGYTIHKTPIYDEVVERVRSGKSSGVVIPYGDRLTRNWWGVGPFYEQMDAVEGEIVFVGRPDLDYRDPDGQVLTGMDAVMQTKTAREARRRGNIIANRLVHERGVPNKVSYGYRRNGQPDGQGGVVKIEPHRDEKALVVHEPEAEVVRRIYQLRLDGFSVTAITQRLNDEGVRSPRGGYWVHKTVSGLIANEAYLGVVKLGERRNENAHTALVSRADWERAQVAPVTIRRSGRFIGGVAVGITYCSSCGRPMSSRGLSGGKLTYGCRRLSGSGPCPRPMYVKAEAVDDFVDRLMVQLLTGGKMAVFATAHEIEAARRDLEARVEQVRLHAELDIDDPADWKAGYTAKKTRERDARERYEALLAQADQAELLPTSAGAWRALTLAGQRRVVQSVLSRVVVHPPKSRSRFESIDARFQVLAHDGRELVSPGGQLVVLG